MKSIFHICDLFFYAANTKEFPFKQVYPVNYWDDPENLRRYKSFSDEDINELLKGTSKNYDLYCLSL